MARRSNRNVKHGCIDFWVPVGCTATGERHLPSESRITDRNGVL